MGEMLATLYVDNALPTTSAMSTTFRHRHYKQGRLIEAAQIQVMKSG